MRSARMLIVDRGNGNKARDDALRALDGLLPSHWQIIGNIPQKPGLKTERRGSTNAFDALVIGEKTISIVNIANEPGTVRVRIGRPYEVDGEEVAWATDKPSSLRDFNNEVHKLCLLLRDRLDIDPYRVAGKMIWVGATQIDHESSATREEVTDIEQFVELAVKRDERTMLGPLPKRQVEAIAEYFLGTQEEEDEARSLDPEGLGESIEDFLIVPNDARSGAERALPAPGRAAPRKAMVRSASDADDAPSASPVYRFDDWAEATENFGPAREVRPVQPNVSGARTAWLWLGGGGLFALGAATAALVLVVDRPQRSPVVAAVAQRNEGAQAQDFGAAPDVSTPGPIDYGPVEDFAPGALPQAVVDYGAAAPLPPAPVAAPAPAPHRAAVARTQIAAAVTRKAALSPQAPKAKVAPTKPAQPASGEILCILPKGGEMQMSRASCRAQSGLIYR